MANINVINPDGGATEYIIEDTNGRSFIAAEQATLTASKNYAIGNLFWYENTLYKATAAISSGGTIVISGNNANATSTTIEAELNNNYASTQTLLKDTVGWTGKNLVENTASTQTINGVTFIVNADKSVTVNGTATADAVFVIHDRVTDDLNISAGTYIGSGIAVISVVYAVVYITGISRCTADIRT